MGAAADCGEGASSPALDLLALLGLPNSGALDDSAPLSAPDLRALMNKMQIRSEQVKDRVRQCITSHHQDFQFTISRANNAVNEFGNISKELDSVLQQFDVDVSQGAVNNVEGTEKQESGSLSVHLELLSLVEETRKARKEAQEKRNALGVVEFISHLNNKLTSAKRDIAHGDFPNAAQDLLDVRNALGLPADWNEEEEVSITEEVRPYAFLRHLLASCFSQIRLSLEELLARAVVLDAEDSKLHICPCLTGEKDVSLNGVQLTTIHSAMEKIGGLDAALAKFADTLLKTVISSILQEPLKVDIFEESGATGKAVLSWSSSSEDGMVPTILYAKLLKVVKFLRQHLCCGNDNWTIRLGRLVWPRMAEAIISGYLSKAVPNEISDVARFQELAALTKEFETTLSKIKFIPDLGSDGDRLGKFATDVEIHFASKKKSRVLARTRRLLVRSDFNVFSSKTLGRSSKEIQKVSEENLVELLFQQETCAVSWAAKQLMQIVHEVLEDACGSAPKTALELYHAARDAFLLYPAIVPVKLAKELNNLSQEAVICHNDCLFLANEILGLAYQYREVLVSKLKDTFVFVDLVPLFQQTAVDVIRQQIQIIESSLDQALDQGNGFRNTNKKQYYEMASLAIEQVVFLLEKIRMIWRPVMAQSIYAKSMGSLMNLVFGRLASEILNLDDMDIEETVQLRRLIFSLEESLFPMLQSLVGDVSEKQNRPEGGKSLTSLNQIGKMVPTWCKLLRLAELLDMSLIAITQAWEGGNLAVCGFSSSEVQKLITAVFSDTDLRKESLRRISAKMFA